MIEVSRNNKHGQCISITFAVASIVFSKTLRSSIHFIHNSKYERSLSLHFQGSSVAGEVSVPRLECSLVYTLSCTAVILLTLSLQLGEPSPPPTPSHALPLSSGGRGGGKALMAPAIKKMTFFVASLGKHRDNQ